MDQKDLSPNSKQWTSASDRMPISLLIRESDLLSSEDDAIIEAARRTSDLLNLGGYYPTSVLWKSTIGYGRGTKVVTPHFPEVQGSKLVISPILQGRVDSQDWGSILAPPLIFKGLRGLYNVGALSRILPGFLFLAGFLILGYTYPRLFSSLIFGFIVVDVILLILGAYGIIRLGRKLVLEADKEAAEVIGTGSLIEALRKLEHLRELDASKGNDWPEYGDHPSITRRIANLQNP